MLLSGGRIPHADAATIQHGSACGGVAAHGRGNDDCTIAIPGLDPEPADATRAAVLDIDHERDAFPCFAAGPPIVIQSPLLTTTFSAQVLPIDIIVPATNPTAPGCGHAYLPVTLRQYPVP